MIGERIRVDRPGSAAINIRDGQICEIPRDSSFLANVIVLNFRYLIFHLQSGSFLAQAKFYSQISLRNKRG